MAINGKPTVISTFAGTGGSSLGYHMAGFQELLAVDFDEHAVECFKANFPEVPVWHASVTDIQAEDILRFCKIEKGQLDVFDGSPPCQGFSTAGKREVTDERNDLFLHYCRLLDGLQPKVFVMENVTGMIKGKMKGKFFEILGKLKSFNYEVKCKQLNSMYYGVPQSRQRLFFIGVRKDIGLLPEFPTPNAKVITASEAIAHIQNNLGDTHELTDKYGQLWPKIPPGKNAAHVLNGKGFNNCYKVHPGKPFPTLPKTQGKRGFATMVHWAEPRSISINEAKAACSFPQDWILTGKYEEQWARLGNAVMPLQMKAIAETIKEKILNQLESHALE